MIPDGGAFQDFSFILAPGTRLPCLARAWARAGERESGESAGAQRRMETFIKRPRPISIVRTL
ncbi:MAG TPA: hypothetical protein VF294_06745, partial [Polyangiaceae bacterium]